MKVAALLIVMLSNDGYWISGTDGQLIATWAADAAAVPCDLHWELKLGQTRLGGDKAPIGPGQSATVSITCPDVRTRLTLRWDWRLVRKQDGQQLESGSEKIIAYPANLTRGWQELVRGKRILLLDPISGLPAILKQAKVPFVEVNDAAALQRASADIIIIGPDALTIALFEQAPLQALAQSGVAVAVLRQSKVSHVLGFELRARLPADALHWPTDAPLLRGLDAEDLHRWEQAWKRAQPDLLLALRVPNRELSEALVTWPVGAQGGALPAALHPEAVDGLLLSTSGRVKGGRLVLCQMPLNPWLTDPRSQIFLGNLLDSLVAPPLSIATAELPTAQGARRPSAITISPGDAR